MLHIVNNVADAAAYEVPVIHCCFVARNEDPMTQGCLSAVYEVPVLDSVLKMLVRPSCTISYSFIGL